MTQLTGEALFHLVRDRRQPYDLAWCEIGESAQAFYNKLAEKITAQHIAPLQGQQQKIDVLTSVLVSCRTFVERVQTGPVFFDVECDSLLRILDALLGEEQKVR